MIRQLRHHTKLTCFILFLIFCSGCIAPETTSHFTCSFIPSDDIPPNWVLGDNSLDGYYVGIGQAEKKHADDDPDALIKMARSNALENLAQNIQVKVKSALNMKRIHNEENNRITFSENISSDVSTHTDLTIYDIRQDGLWLDRNKCIVWMRIKVKQAFVDNLFIISQAETHYKKSKQSHLSLKDRIQHIKESIALIQSVDFSSVQSKGKRSIYLQKYQAVKSRLEKQSAGRQLMYVVHSPEIIGQSVRDALVTRFMDTHRHIPAWYEKDIDCMDINICLEMARTNRALYLAYLQLKPEVTSVAMGFSKARLSIVVSLYDVQTGQRMIQKPSEPVTASFHDEKMISWEKMIKVILETNWFDDLCRQFPGG
jgi:hypothetical protein